MIGPRYWSTGITVVPHGDGKWSAKAEFLDGGFCDQDSSEGELRARYIGELPHVIDLVKADAEALGIEFRPMTPDSAPCLYMIGDGERDDIDYPEGWYERLKVEAKRIGWSFL